MFPKYNLNDGLDMIYTLKDDLIFKKLVNCGVNYIENNQITGNLRKVDTTGTNNKDNAIFPDGSKAEVVDENSVDKPRQSKLKKKRNTKCKAGGQKEVRRKQVE